MMLAPEMRVEIRVWDAALIPAAPIDPGLFSSLYLPLRPGLLMPILLPPLLLFLFLPLLLLLHLAVVFWLLRMPVTALRLLVLSSFALWRHLAAIPALRLLISPILWPRLFLRPRLLLWSSLLLPILRVRILLLIVLMLVLRDGRDRRSQ
jgi:hypothetical protein